MRWSSLLAVLSLGLCQPVSARPTVFIAGKAGNAWWTNKPVARPMSKAVDGVSVASLNVYRSNHETAPDEICYVDALEKDSVLGLDRKTQQAIDESLGQHKGHPFHRSAVTADGKPFTVRVAVYESCSGTVGGAILVIGPDHKLEHAAFHDDDPLKFLWPAESPALVGASGCFECGDWSSLYYDVTRKRFYWEYEGD